MINEERITITNDIKIGATISYQDKTSKRPLVLIIMGTGTTDRDGNTKGFHSNLYKDLSDVFVKMGCVCVRYDKRGTHESTGNYKTASLTNFVNDAANVIHYAKKLNYVDENKIIVCGHSEGAMIATLLTRIENLYGIILLGGACTGMKEAMLYQNYLILEQAQNMKGILGWYLRKVLKKEKITKQVNDLFNKAMKSNKKRYFYNGAFFDTEYMREHYSLTSKSYIELLKKYKGRILAITGKSDVQADYRSLENIRNLNDTTIYTPENINHILREIDGDNNILTVKKQYKRLLKNNIYSGIKKEINDWLTK